MPKRPAPALFRKHPTPWSVVTLGAGDLDLQDARGRSLTQFCEDDRAFFTGIAAAVNEREEARKHAARLDRASTEYDRAGSAGAQPRLNRAGTSFRLALCNMISFGRGLK